MSNAKISALSSVSTPLAGTEVLPIVQSSTTKKVSISEIQTAPVSTGTANGVVYLNGSKVPTSGTQLVFDGTNNRLGIGTSSPSYKLHVQGLTQSIYLSDPNTGVNLRLFNGGSGDTGISGITFPNQIISGSASVFELFTTSSNPLVFGTASTERARIDSSGNVGIGTTSPTSISNQTSLTINGTNVSRLDLYQGGTTTAGFVASSTASYLETRTATPLVFITNNTERARIDSSGNFLLGTTGLGTIGSSSGFQITPSGAIYSASTGDSVFSRRSSDGTVITFRRDTTSVGSIDVTTTATTYNTSSDYRLKNTIAPMTGALAKVAKLKPVTYKWNVDGSDGEGFIAHELAEVCPHAVVGEKDGTQIEQYEISPAVPAIYDENRNELTAEIKAVMGEREVPKYQGIDTSFLVATLTAALQEQQAIIESLKARLDAANL